MSSLPATVETTRAALKKGEISAEEVLEHSLQQIEAWQPLNTFIEVLADDARAQAKTIDSHGLAHAEDKPLAGIPIAVKDLICTTEGHTTAASRILQQFRSPYEATVISRLKQAGAIVIGKSNLDEFAMGSSTEYSAFGPTKNPWDPDRVAGGSSGGSAVAVATGQTLLALGTDTGGSIRLPASFCNVVGVKPTYGRVSRFGVIAYGSSLDQVGPFARTVADAALLLEILAGADTHDATSSPQAVPQYTAVCGQDIKSLTIGVPKEFFVEGLDPAVETVVRQAIQELETLGATVKEISLPLTSAAIAVYYLIAKSEASTNLARYDGLRFPALEVKAKNLLEQYLETRGQGFGPEVKRAILMGTFALSAGYYDAWYKQASKVRTLIRREYETAFKEVDVMAGPIAPEVAFPIGSKANDPLAMYLSDALTVPLSVAGLPALSVPAGFAQDLPVGLQLAAPHFQEERLFQVAAAYEAAHPWWQQQPSLKK
jgi:aspartyl-tRNA(Asn)/glutamyl-tRNA(Gln) amidotransferase subunit A